MFLMCRSVIIEDLTAIKAPLIDISTDQFLISISNGPLVTANQEAEERWGYAACRRRWRVV